MKFLLDENLSPKLLAQLSALLPLIHVRDVGLMQSSDQAIWSWAKANGCSIITTDRDFVALSRRLGLPPKVIYIERCDVPSRIIADMLRRNAVRIVEFEERESKSVLILRLR